MARKQSGIIDFKFRTKEKFFDPRKRGEVLKAIASGVGFSH